MSVECFSWASAPKAALWRPRARCGLYWPYGQEWRRLQVIQREVLLREVLLWAICCPGDLPFVAPVICHSLPRSAVAGGAVREPR